MVEDKQYPLVSICVPTYYANGHQERILKRLIKSVREQTYPNIELVISDQDALLDKLTCELLDGKVKVKFLAFEDDSGISAHNTNNALENAAGDYIQILNHDDFLYHENSLRNMVAKLEAKNVGWVATACLHTDENETKLDKLHIPYWPGEKNMVEGINRIGCPSVVLFKNELNLRCDPEIIYAMDCSMWLDLFRASGEPAILHEPAIVVRAWDQQFTNKMNTAKQLELDKITMRKKYGYT